MKIRISCEDKYEAQKLASLIFVNESQETYIKEILDIIENELVMGLKDQSAHSVLLKDQDDVESFADFIQSVLEEKHKIIATATFDEQVEIIKN